MLTNSSGSRPARVALATCAAQPELFGEEQHLVEAMRARGVDACAAVWDDRSIDWTRFDRVILRSTWDYYERIEEFRAWLESLTARAIPLSNPAALVAWNLDKIYLRDLETRGVPIVPTVFLSRGARADISAITEARGWEDAVVKPAISAAAFRTHRTSAMSRRALQNEVDAVLETTGVLVQPFLPEIAREGEWSLCFFGGHFSHAVLKTPDASDFRVQIQFGGTFRRVEPPGSTLTCAARICAELPFPADYARIDGVQRGGRFLVMEVELIEPYLYFAAAPEAESLYVDAVLRGLEQR